MARLATVLLYCCPFDRFHPTGAEQRSGVYHVGAFVSLEYRCVRICRVVSLHRVYCLAASVTGFAGFCVPGVYRSHYEVAVVWWCVFVLMLSRVVICCVGNCSEGMISS